MRRFGQTPCLRSRDDTNSTWKQHLLAREVSPHEQWGPQGTGGAAAFPWRFCWRESRSLKVHRRNVGSPGQQGRESGEERGEREEKQKRGEESAKDKRRPHSHLAMERCNPLNLLPRINATALIPLIIPRKWRRGDMGDPVSVDHIAIRRGCCFADAI